LPALRHEAQTFLRFVCPLISVRIFWIFGFQRRRVARFEWETLLPKLGALPQISHTEDTLFTPLFPIELIRGERLPRRGIKWLIRWVITRDKAGGIGYFHYGQPCDPIAKHSR